MKGVFTGGLEGQKFECNDKHIDIQNRLRKSRKIVSPDCRPPSIITAPKSSKMLVEPCGTERKSHSSYMNFVHVYHSRSVKSAVGTAKIQTRADTPDIFHKHGMSYYDYGKS